MTERPPAEQTLFWMKAGPAPCGSGLNGQIPPDFLSPEEAQRWSGMRFAKRRDEWLLGRWTAKQLLRRADRRYRRSALAEIRVENEPGGAPYYLLPGDSRYPGCLSISHCGQTALCALSPDPAFRIGVDLEQITPRPQCFVDDFFTPAEAAWVRSTNGGCRDLTTTLIWSAKETVLKALRVGLQEDTRRVEILPVSGCEDHAGPWGWRQFEVQSPRLTQAQFWGWWRCSGDTVWTLGVLKERSGGNHLYPPPAPEEVRAPAW